MLASVRREIILPAKALEARGISTHVISLQQWPREQVASIIAKADRVVFGKLLANLDLDSDDAYSADIRAYQHVLQAAKADTRVAFCFADDHFDNTGFAGFYRASAPISRVWIASAQVLRERLVPHAQCPVLVYPEPAESLRAPSRVPRRGMRERAAVWMARRAGVGLDPWRLRLLWFGHPTNIPSLLGTLPELNEFAADLPVSLQCVTQPGTQLEEVVTRSMDQTSKALQITTVPWSLPLMAAAFEDCDAVILPQTLEDPRKRAKSNNRMVDAINAGRFVVAHPIPSYENLGKFAWVGDSIADGLRWLLRHPDEALRRLEAGQEFIGVHHSLSALAGFWVEALELQPAAHPID